MKKQLGSIHVEYLVVFVLVVLVLVNGDPSPLERFFDAIKLAYAKFCYAMSLP